MLVRDWDEPTIKTILLKLEPFVIGGLILFSLLSSLASAVHAPDVPIVPKGETFTCTVISVWDDDGPIWCAEGPRVRLARINARELDGTCRPGAPCPDAGGIEARDHLVELLGGATGRTRDGYILVNAPPMRCLSDGWGKGVRTAAWCRLKGRDLSATMVRDGYAERWLHPRPSR